METTRHFTATVYIVNEGATALHHHDRLGIRIPPGGHVDRDELPHEAGSREVREETGLEPRLLRETAAIDAPAGEVLPQPAHMMLYDINVHPDVTVTKGTGFPPMKTPVDTPAAPPVLDTLSAVWDADPVELPVLGGSLPAAFFRRVDALADVRSIVVGAAGQQKALGGA